MSEVELEFVSYEPPKSVCFGHQARMGNARAAWKSIKTFLHERTEASLNEHISLRCVWPFDGPVGAFNEFRAHANEKLGTNACGEWFFSPSQFEQALALAFDEDLWPKQSEGPACLSFGYSFEWKTALKIGDSILPRVSQLHATVSGQRIFLQPTLVFPWPWSSNEIRTFLGEVEQDLPFQLRSQYFKRMLPTKKGDYRVLKLSRDWLDVA